LWDVETGKEVRTFRGHTNTVDGVAFSTDGRRALCAGYHHTLRLWDVATGKELDGIGHTDTVFCVVFTPDGRFALSGGADKLLRLWRLPDLPPAGKP
jgi:WD40 repeat protein